MRKNVLRGFSVILGVLFLFGCTATKDVEVRRYIEVKDRVDQNMEEGNAGFIAGTPQPEDRSGIRKTRKIYVVEVSKGTDLDEASLVAEDEGAMIDESDYMDYGSGEKLETMDFSGNDDSMMVDDTDMGVEVDEVFVSPPSTVEYTIQKDDTLQKISKKFYDSYSKWMKIYEVNKDVIDDPNRIKPGTVIQIPAL